MTKKRRKVRKSSGHKRLKGSPQQALVKALSHPVRAKTLTILSDRISSPSEISSQLDVPLGNVSYHMRVLEELGFVEVVEEEKVRGAVAHFYRAVDRALFDSSAWKRLDPITRSAVWAQLVETLLEEAAASLAAGYFDKRSDRHASRKRLVLDERGWKAVIKIQAQALDRILKEGATAAERLKISDEGAIHAVLAMFCFEMPPDGER